MIKLLEEILAMSVCFFFIIGIVFALAVFSILAIPIAFLLFIADLADRRLR